MGYSLGIDIGTTYSAAAVARQGTAEIFSLGIDRAAIPSIVLLRDDGEVLVGDAAERRAIHEPTRVAREFKRRMGDPTPIIVGGTPYGVEALTAHVLRWIVAEVGRQEGGPADAVALTHPASWGSFKLDLLHQAARLAGIPDAHLISEPEAAALRYARQGRVEPGSVVAVYDFGGGTVDVALVRSLGDDRFELIGTPEGMERLGGIDFDQAVYAHVDASLDGMLADVDIADPAVRAALARLRTDCRQAKEALSADTDTVVPVMLPGLQTNVRLTRSEFEGMIRPRIDETIEMLERTVKTADLTVTDLSAVLLVGGTSRIPLIGEAVHSRTGVPVNLDSHPKATISLGAALLADRALAPVAATDEAAVATADVGPAETVESVETIDADPPPPEVEERPPSAAASSGSRRNLVIGAVIAALVLVAAVVLFSRGGEETEAATTTTVATSAGTPATTGATTATTAPATTAAPTTSTIAVTTTTAATTTSATTATTVSPATTGATPAGYTRVTDGSGLLSVDLPVGWTSIDGSSITFLDGVSPHISASTDLVSYLDTWTTPGITVIAVDRATVGSATTLLDVLDSSIGYSFSCIPGVAEPYADGRFGGEARVWVGCDGTTNAIAAVGADDGGDTLFGLILQTTGDADLAVLDQALRSLTYAG
jgi:actin-like ATPase involved in cell morphogenesis